MRELGNLIRRFDRGFVYVPANCPGGFGKNREAGVNVVDVRIDLKPSGRSGGGEQVFRHSWPRPTLDEETG